MYVIGGAAIAARWPKGFEP